MRYDKRPKCICQLKLFDVRTKRCEVIIYEEFKNNKDYEIGDYMVISFSQLRRHFTIDKTMSVLYGY